MCFSTASLCGRIWSRSSVQPRLIDLLDGHTEQVVQGRLPVPVFRNVELARWLRESGQHQDRRNGRPRHILTTRFDQGIEQRVKPQGAPQPSSQPDISKLPGPLEPHPLQLDGHRLRGLLLRVEPVSRDSARATNLPSQGTRLGTPRGVQLSQRRHRFLADSSPRHEHSAPSASRRASCHPYEPSNGEGTPGSLLADVMHVAGERIQGGRLALHAVSHDRALSPKDLQSAIPSGSHQIVVS